MEGLLSTIPRESGMPKSLVSAEVKNTIEVREFLPVEVKEEIKRLLELPKNDRMAYQEKGRKARQARGQVARLLEERDLIEVGLRGIPPNYKGDKFLGADSHTDRLLVAFAISLIEKDGYFGAVIATDDGGIEVDVKTVRKQSGQQLYCATSRSKRSLTTLICQAIEPLRVSKVIAEQKEHDERMIAEQKERDEKMIAEKKKHDEEEYWRIAGCVLIVVVLGVALYAAITHWDSIIKFVSVMFDIAGQVLALILLVWVLSMIFGRRR